MLRILIIITTVLVGFPGHASLRAEATDDAQLIESPQQQREGGFFRRGHARRDINPLGLVPLLRVESVRQELKLDGEQTTVIEELSISISEEFKKDLSALLESIREMSPEERLQLRKRTRETRKKINERIQQALSNEQFERLRQIGYQLDLRRSGAAATLTSSDLAAALDLTKEQKQQLREQGQASKSAKAKGKPPTLDEARAITKDILSAEQHEKLDTLLGTEFDLPEAMLKKSPQRRLGGRNQEGEPKKRRLRRLRPEQESTEKAGTNKA